MVAASRGGGGSRIEDPKSRFSDRAENYAKYRPGYPQEVLGFLEERCALRSGSTIADIGSGAGALSALFLEGGHRVFGVEPNREMREAAERLLGDHPLFESVDGSAEDTTLEDQSVDLVAVANSLHWVERDAARAEFSRVLRPGGRVAVVWSMSRSRGTPFLEAHTELVLAHRTGGGTGGAGDAREMTEAFFDGGHGGHQGHETARFPYFQALDFEGLKGLVLSSSTMPAPGRPGSEEMLRDLEGIFGANESGGEVVMEYEVSVYCGLLD